MATPSPATPLTGKPNANGSANGGSKKTTYISRGQMLDSPPLTVRLNSFVTSLYNLGGLYVTTLFSMDPYNAGMNSRFNTRGPGRSSSTSSSTAAAGNPSAAGGRPLGGGGSTRGSGWFGWGGGNGGNGGGRPGAGGRRMGTVDDVRGPECGSCG